MDYIGCEKLRKSYIPGRYPKPFTIRAKLIEPQVNILLRNPCVIACNRMEKRQAFMVITAHLDHPGFRITRFANFDKPRFGFNEINKPTYVFVDALGPLFGFPIFSADSGISQNVPTGDFTGSA